MPTKSSLAAIGLAVTALLVPAAVAAAPVAERAAQPTAAKAAAAQSATSPAASPAMSTAAARQSGHRPSPTHPRTQAKANAATTKSGTTTPGSRTTGAKTPTTTAKTSAKGSSGAPKPSSAAAAPTTTPSSGTAHFTVNLGGSYAAARAVGFNVFDVAGSTSNPAGVKAKLDALPSGSKAMVWVGNLGKSAGAEGFTRAQFKAQVDALAHDSRVFGYFIADEPHPILYPSVVAEIAARADYVRSVAPTQKSFIVVLDGSKYCSGGLGCEYAALAPSKTRVDIVGIDSYPCSTGSACKLEKITERVNAAVNAGIPRSKIAPVYQTFGQAGDYYRMPTAAELEAMLKTWRANVPSPVMDYAYTWGTQSSSPEALINHPAQQLVVKAHNAG